MHLGVCHRDTGRRVQTIQNLPIPKEEHGYSNFESMVIATRDESNTFLATVSGGQDMGWNRRADFEKQIAQANLDFSKETLVLLRHTEGSGSIQISFRPPTVTGKRVMCHIDRIEPDFGTDDMAYYCFALAVDKAQIEEVELIVSGKDQILLPVKPEDPSGKPEAGHGK